MSETTNPERTPFETLLRRLRDAGDITATAHEQLRLWGEREASRTERPVLDGSMLDQVARRVRSEFKVGPFGPITRGNVANGGQAWLDHAESSEVTRIVLREARRVGLGEPFDPSWRVHPPAGWSVFGTHVDRDGPIEFWGSEFDVETGMPIWERPAVSDEADLYVPDTGPVRVIAAGESGWGVTAVGRPRA